MFFRQLTYTDIDIYTDTDTEIDTIIHGTLALMSTLPAYHPSLMRIAGQRLLSISLAISFPATHSQKEYDIISFQRITSTSVGI